MVLGVYVPAANSVDDPATVLELLRRASVGHLVSMATDAEGRGAFDATLLPFLVDDDLSTVRAHFARANPQWRTLDGVNALLIVPVSDAYVSPSWYPSKVTDPRVVPTWNYEVVHVHGTVRVRDDAPFVDRVVRDLTVQHESARTVGAGQPALWSVDDAPLEFIQRQLRAIVGIELTMERIDAKRKLSQNRSIDDRRGVVEGLSTYGDTALAESMRTLDD